MTPAACCAPDVALLASGAFFLADDTMASSIAAVIDQMERQGMPPLDGQRLQVNTGKVVRYGPKKRAWYRVWEVQGRNGRPHYFGAYGLHGRIDSTRIEFDAASVSEDERARLKALAAAQQQREEEARAARARRARLSAQQAWAEARVPAAPLGYLLRKQVPVHAVRAEPDDVIVVPMLRYDWPRERALVGVQRIWPDGAKRFTAGAAKQGSAVRLGDRPVDGAPILLCEGLATGLSIRESTGRTVPVFAAFDAGNLLEVAPILRALLPKSPIGICADDDFRTPGNPGRLYAFRAARAVGRAQILRPQFSARGDAKWTDFNDLQIHEGMDAVRVQLTRFVRFLERI